MFAIIKLIFIVIFIIVQDIFIMFNATPLSRKSQLSNPTASTAEFRIMASLWCRGLGKN
jgi:L-asparagine transporter-like permease